MITHFKNLLRHHKPDAPNSTVPSPDKAATSDARHAAVVASSNHHASRTTDSRSVHSATAMSAQTRVARATAGYAPVAHQKPQAASQPSANSADRFQLLERMGDGAFSVVYKAYDRQLQSHVAIKVARKFQMKSSQRSSIYKEVSIMRSLHHDNVVSLLDFRESNDYFYLIMDLVPGGELFNRIVELTYFSEPLARHVILQVAEAIRYLHNERGVVHRDIKPENILFDPIAYIPDPTFVSSSSNRGKKDEGIFIEGVGGGGIGRVRLADFGLSKVVWNEPTLTPCGTVGYTAPEIVNDQKYSTGVDMWALGCVLYTMLCGFPPFYDEDVQILTQKVACGYYTFLSPWWDPISDSAKDLISHLLTVSPRDRYSIDEFLAHPWCQARLSTDMEGVETCLPGEANYFQTTPLLSNNVPKSVPMTTPQTSRSPVADAPVALPVRTAPAAAAADAAPLSPLASPVPSGALAAVTPQAVPDKVQPLPSRKYDALQTKSIRESPNRKAKGRVQNLRIDLHSLGLDQRSAASPAPSVLFTPGGRQRVMAKTPMTPVLTLKEAFDVSYAVRRVENEEATRRQHNTPFPSARTTPLTGGITPRGGPNGYPFHQATIGGATAAPKVSTPLAREIIPNRAAKVQPPLQQTLTATSQGLKVVPRDTAPQQPQSSTPAVTPAQGSDTVLASYANPLFSPIPEAAEEIDDDRLLIKALFQRNAERLVVRGTPAALDENSSATLACTPSNQTNHTSAASPDTVTSGCTAVDGDDAPTPHFGGDRPLEKDIKLYNDGVSLDLSDASPTLNELDTHALPQHQAGLHMTLTSSQSSSSSEDAPVFDLDLSHSTLLNKRRRNMDDRRRAETVRIGTAS
ncbi:MAPK-activated protein kinase Srk1 [Tieghemiomyces parasiticus]|uniref:MAPK-activated protein kinase Srk1 n=1 Tax=Tieghemiomyces parasiticus TaxID=78921 RepID=A0A9W8DNS5_9FUNG|nr:MAPK-activated protein kinase Srk1 [Tieghemiomyces parasiticus]